MKMKVDHIEILDKALAEVFDKHSTQVLCLDNDSERSFLKGMILGTFFRLKQKTLEKNNEPNS